MSALRAVLGITLAGWFALLAGCAATPQIVPVRPSVDSAALPSRGTGRTIALDVIDARGDTVIGYRDPNDTASVITSAPETLRNLERSVRAGYEALGFRIVEPGAEADIALEVRLTELGYAREADGVVRDVKTGATVEVTSVMATKTVNGTYRDAQGKGTVVRPSLEANAEVLNRHLSVALSKMIADERLTAE